MKYWIAIDNFYPDVYGRGTITLHLYEPKLSKHGRWKDDTAYGFLCTLPKNDFPELKFEESPKQIELNII